MMDKAAIARNFSRYAHLYDRYADIQRLAAGRLMRYLPDAPVKNILEIGCGTGIYTSYLREKFKDANLEALDISDTMVGMAKNRLRDGRVIFRVEDGETPKLASKFNLITSNAAFQWFEDLNRAVGSYEGLLSEDGMLVFSIFGPRTFKELKTALKATFGKEAEISSADFPEKGKIKDMLSSRFKKVAIKEYTIKEKHASLMHLLRKIKYTGTRGMGFDTKQAWDKASIAEAEESYIRMFGSIEATYQIFFCKAVK